MPSSVTSHRGVGFGNLRWFKPSVSFGIVGLSFLFGWRGRVRKGGGEIERQKSISGWVFFVSLGNDTSGMTPPKHRNQYMYIFIFFLRHNFFVVKSEVYHQWISIRAIDHRSEKNSGVCLIITSTINLATRGGSQEYTLYTWNPNDPSFDSKRDLVLEGSTTNNHQNRGKITKNPGIPKSPSRIPPFFCLCPV